MCVTLCVCGRWGCGDNVAKYTRTQCRHVVSIFRKNMYKDRRSKHESNVSGKREREREREKREKERVDFHLEGLIFAFTLIVVELYILFVGMG